MIRAEGTAAPGRASGQAIPVRWGTGRRSLDIEGRRGRARNRRRTVSPGCGPHHADRSRQIRTAGDVEEALAAASAIGGKSGGADTWGRPGRLEGWRHDGGT
jgi:hypothetical protein